MLTHRSLQCWLIAIVASLLLPGCGLIGTPPVVALIVWAVQNEEEEGHEYPAPEITGVSPSSGPSSGGTPVDLSGNGFREGMSVSFGGNAASNVVLVSGNEATCTTPAHAAGPGDVQVTNPDGKSSLLPSAFTFIDAPEITDVSPNSGPTAGGTSVSLTGIHFQSGCSVTFGGLAAQNVARVNSTLVTCETPSNTAGSKDVTLSNPDSQASTLLGGFEYVPPPDLVSLDPADGCSNGGFLVTLSGTGFRSGATVTFGGSPGTDVLVQNATTITCTAPAHASGLVDVVVENPDQQTGLLSSGFEYWDEWTVLSTNGSYAYCIDINSTRMVIGGCKSVGTNSTWRIEKRVLSDGTLEASFGSSGVLTYSSFEGFVSGIAFTGDSFIVVGFDQTSGSGRIEKRSLADGSLETGFGTNGVSTSAITYPYEVVHDGAFFYVCGLGGGTNRCAAEKRTIADGSLENGFGTSGVLRWGGSSDNVHAMDLDGSDLYFACLDYSLGAGNAQWRIEKRSAVTGALDSGFGVNGIVVSNPSSSDDWVESIFFFDGSLFVTGSSRGMARWRIEKRSASDGSFDADFGSGGWVQENYSTARDVAYDARADDSGLYVVGESDGLRRIEKRSTGDGIIAFQDTSVTSPADARAVALDATAMYVAGMQNGKWRIEKRGK